MADESHGFDSESQLLKMTLIGKDEGNQLV